MSSIYKKKIVPYLTRKTYQRSEIYHKRKELLNRVLGDILEIGIGEGENLPYYPENVYRITAIDQEEEKYLKSKIHVDYYKGSVTELPFPDETFDTIVSMFCFGEIQDLDIAMKEIRRVLKPRGRLIFLEFGKADKNKEGLVQSICSPMYRIMTAGYQVNRDYYQIMKEYGFILPDTKITHFSGSKDTITGYLYPGIAVKV